MRREIQHESEQCDNHNEMSEEDITNAVAAVMLEHGGSFVRALCHIFYFADPINHRKIKEQFYREWNEYADLAGVKP